MRLGCWRAMGSGRAVEIGWPAPDWAPGWVVLEETSDIVIVLCRVMRQVDGLDPGSTTMSSGSTWDRPAVGAQKGSGTTRRRGEVPARWASPRQRRGSACHMARPRYHNDLGARTCDPSTRTPVR